MSTFDNLLSNDGSKFIAKIDGVDAKGEICVCEGRVYLLQNSRAGTSPPNRDFRGYDHSWVVDDGTPAQLQKENVRDFHLTDPVLKHGAYYSCKIGPDYVEGKITVEDGLFYLCQNKRDGSRADVLHEYLYSWGINDGSLSAMRIANVTEFKLLDKLDKPVNSFKVGDIIRYNVNGTYYLVTKVESDNISIRDSSYKLYLFNQKACFDYTKTCSVSFVVNELIPGNWLKINKLVDYSSATCSNRSVDYVPIGASIKISRIGNICDLSDGFGLYISFAAYYNDKEYGFCISRRNEFTNISTPTVACPSNRFKVGDRVTVKSGVTRFKYGASPHSSTNNGTICKIYPFDSHYNCNKVGVDFDNGRHDWDIGEDELEFLPQVEPVLRHVTPITPTLGCVTFITGDPGDKKSMYKPEPTLKFKTVKKFSL